MGLVQNFQKRLDGWFSAITGVGVLGTDKRLSYTMGALYLIPDQELSALFHGDDIAGKIVSLLPEEAMSRGYQITGPEPEQVDEWKTALEELDFWCTLRRAAIFSRLYGGGALVLVVDDGQTSPEAQSLPLRKDRIRRVEAVKYTDRRRLTRVLGVDGLWRLEPVRGGESAIMIHESRLVFLGGADTDDEMREQLDGWGFSVLQRCYHVIRDHAAAWASVSLRLQESSYSKTVIKGLARMLASGQEDAVKSRLELLNYSRSAAKTIILDSEEAYQRDIDNLTGIDDVLTVYQSRVAAAAGMPVTKLWGTSARGLNATGEGDADDWARQVQVFRNSYLQTPLEVVLELVAASAEGPFGGQVPEGWSIEWPELEPMSDKERAEIYKLLTDADAVNIDRQVLDPEEVALHRFKGMGYDAGNAFAIDLKEREESLEMRRELREKGFELGMEGGEDEQPGDEGSAEDEAEGGGGEAGGETGDE